VTVLKSRGVFYTMRFEVIECKHDRTRFGKLAESKSKKQIICFLLTKPQQWYVIDKEICLKTDEIIFLRRLPKIDLFMPNRLKLGAGITHLSYSSSDIFRILGMV
jgi:hypothetical protein